MPVPDTCAVVVANYQRHEYDLLKCTVLSCVGGVFTYVSGVCNSSTPILTVAWYSFHTEHHHSWLTYSPCLWCLQLPTSTTVLQGASFSLSPHEPVRGFLLGTYPGVDLWVKAYVNISFYQVLADCSPEWGSNFTIPPIVPRFSFLHVLANTWQFWAMLMNVKIVSHCCFNVFVSNYYGGEHLFYCWPFEFSFLFVSVHVPPLPLPAPPLAFSCIV